MQTSTMLTGNRYIGHTEPITLIGIHTMEAPEAGDTAEDVARYFQRPEVQASAHWCVDNNSRVRCVRDEDSAWTMPPTNHRSLNVELAGYAAQNNRQWHDKYSQDTLNNAAVCVAEWCDKYDIPVRHLSHAGIANNVKGLAGHVDVNAVFHGSNHTDPGPYFPWEDFMIMVKRNLKGEHQNPPGPVHNRPDCTALQRIVHTTADNSWGNNTDKNFTALIAATAFGGHTFPYGVKFTQEVVGAAQDGEWGPKSKSKLTLTVTLVQRQLNTMHFSPGTVDGVWGAKTNAAYLSARDACHI